MGIEIVLNENDLLCSWIRLHKSFHKLPVVFLGSSFSDIDNTFPGQRLKGDKHHTRPVSPVLVVLTADASGLHGDRSHHITYQLARPFIKAHDRPFGTVLMLIDVEDLLHAPDELRGQLPYAPLSPQVRFQVVFFRTLFTVWYEMSSTISNSTSLPAMRRKVQRLRPSGGSEQAKAVIFARWRPLNFFGAPGRCCSLIAASRPSLTYLKRTARTVLRETCKASRIRVSPFPSSASSSIRQRVNFRAFSLPLLMSCFNTSRSFALSLTGFLILMATTSFQRQYTIEACKCQ